MKLLRKLNVKLLLTITVIGFLFLGIWGNLTFMDYIQLQINSKAFTVNDVTRVGSIYTAVMFVFMTAFCLLIFYGFNKDSEKKISKTKAISVSLIFSTAITFLTPGLLWLPEHLNISQGLIYTPFFIVSFVALGAMIAQKVTDDDIKRLKLAFKHARQH